MTRIVCKLYESDSFSIENAITVNPNNTSFYHYTLWRKEPTHLYQIPRYFDKGALDLFYIALVVFYADRTEKRSEQPDGWTRSFEIYVPVLEYSKWCALKDSLQKALNFLTGDQWTFNFRNRFCITEQEEAYKKGKWRLRKSTKLIDAEEFCMLSGGLDSYIGAINLLSDNKKVVFVGNYNGGKGVSVYQNKVIEEIVAHFGISRERFFQFYAAPLRANEESTRSRSLLFFSHAILLASGMGKPMRICIPENGMISLNIPLTIHRTGSLSTRTTHPYYIALLQNIINGLGLSIALYNPFQFKTKGEMMMECKDFDFLKSTYPLTMSCSHPDLGRWRKETGSSHCGVCLPCTIRRAAILKAGLHDESIYREPNYRDNEAQVNLRSFKLGLLTPKNPMLAIQESGPIRDKRDMYAQLYQRGLKELDDYIKTIE